MEYRKLGNSDLEVSVIGLGTWAIGNDFWGPADDAESIRAIQAGIDAGINLVDTAPAYGGGHSEKVVGDAVRGRRDNVVLATKVGVIKEKGKFIRTLEPEAMQKQLEDSLKLLQTDVIDLYQIHWPVAKHSEEEALKLMVKMQEAGKIRYIGVSNFGVPLLKQCLKAADIVSLQPPFSLLKQDITTEILPFCMEHNIGILGYGSLAGGLLTGKFREVPQFTAGDNRKKFYNFYNKETWPLLQQFLDVLRNIGEKRGRPAAHVAINWSIQQPGISSALVGARNAEQARSNAAAAEWKLSAEELQRIDTAHKEFIAGNF